MTYYGVIVLANKFHFWLEKISNIDDDSFICNDGSDGSGDRNVMVKDNNIDNSNDINNNQ